ncbi:hypothetical protein [Nitrospirillum viridazoti]|uniref:DUF2029 domain-containing protein n=1 Tax=Nitrospirillum viridazoti CBAmc TaxID=1441467 RepID=A0A248JQ20_9PROT|nr:hypothetical protein [Nitrospirillum amazonense]ASG20689.1 hypothetical protein Y958_07620 [Nitrospirillum amazonense CBAmc]TWB37991.1 hypothetical protein FBZ91_107305 [Nitrospirillum amazonense]
MTDTPLPLISRPTVGRHLAGSLAVKILAIVVLSALLVSRDADWVMHPTLWAEDGVIWFQNAYTKGLRVLVMPSAGYINLFPYAMALVARALPLGWLPGWMMAGGFIAQVAPAVLLLLRGAPLVPSLWARGALVLFYLGVPNSYEIHLNLTNAQWHLMLLSFLMLVLPAPQGRGWRGLQYGVLLVSGLTGPFCVFLAPVALWQWLGAAPDQRRHAFIQAAIVASTALIQVLCLLTLGAGERQSLVLGASATRLARMLTDQVFLSGVLGTANVGVLKQGALWQEPAMAWVIALAGLSIIAFALVKGPSSFRKFCLAGLILLACALVSPAGSPVGDQWALLGMLGYGGRYFVIPILIFFIACLILACKAPAKFRIPACALLCVFMVGVWADWLYPTRSGTFEAYHQAVEAFDNAPPGTQISFPEASPGWNMVLTKR